MNCYDSEIWGPSNFVSQQRRLLHFVLAVSIDKQLFYKHEFWYKCTLQPAKLRSGRSQTFFKTGEA